MVHSQVPSDPVARWREAEDVRAFCAAAQTEADDPEVAGWIKWARAHADCLSPVLLRPAAPAVPADISPSEPLALPAGLERLRRTPALTDRWTGRRR